MSQRRPRLLIVETHASVRRVLGRVLSRRFEVTPLESATSALARLREERFDALLVDLAEHDASALELLRSARTIASGLRVVVTTPLPDSVREGAARDGGAVTYLVKPLDASTLERALALDSSR